MNNRAKLISITPQNRTRPQDLNDWEKADSITQKKEKLIYLDPREVSFSEFDPREFFNEKAHQELLETIRVSGLGSTLKIHRKDEKSPPSLQAGGNRRLRALQELADQGHPGFQLVGFVLVPYQEELQTMFSHLIENAKRLDLTFWEQTTEMFKIKSMLQTKSNAKLTIDDFLKIMKKNAMDISEALYHVRQFACNALGNLSDAHKQNLTLTAVKAIQKDFNLLDSFLEFSPVKTQKDIIIKQAFDDFNQTNDDIRQTLIKNIKERIAHALRIDKQHLDHMLKLFDPKKKEQVNYQTLLSAAQRHQQQNNIKQEVFSIDLNKEKDRSKDKLAELLMLEEGRSVKVTLTLTEENKHILKQLLKN